MANSAFTPAVLTVSGSSSTSSGEKNYVTATDGNASGLWVASGVTVATSTSTIPDNITKASSLAITWTSGTTGYARYRFTLDQADYGKKFKIQWDQVYGTAGHWTLQVYSNTASDYTGTSTQLTVQTSAVPGITGTFTTSVDMSGSSAPYIEIRIVASSTSATTIYLNSILMGPGTITQGAAVGEYETVTSYTITAATTNPTPGSGATYYRSTFREGSYARIRYEYTQTNAGSAGSGTYYLPLPSGLTIDFTRIAVASTGAATNGFVGTGLLNATNNYEVNAFALPSNGTNRIALAAQDTTTSIAAWGSSLGPLSTATVRLSLEVLLPIAEWSGSGTVNLGAGAQVEYASTSEAWDATGTTTVYGPGGQKMSGALTSSRLKTVTWQYPIQTGDLIAVEISLDGNTWMDASQLYPYTVASTNATSGGVTLEASTSTTTAVRFMGYALIGGAGNINWTNSTYWRVRKAKASSPVGFGKADSTSFGLVAPRRGPLVVTSANQATYFSSLPSGFSMTRGVFIYYQDQDLNHRLKFNLVGSMTSATSASFTWASTAVVYKSGVEQAVTAWSGTSGSWSTGRVTGSVMNYYVSAASTYVSLSGDVELDSKPTWA